MTSDLERELQLALREGVEHVTPERLQHDNPARLGRSTQRRNRWTITGPLLAAACVAVLALAITLVATHGNSGNTQTATGRPRPAPSLVGTSWTLTSVRHDGTTTAISQNLSASVTFERHSVLSAQDGINTYRGTYTSSRDGTISIRGISVSAAGYAGHDPGTLAAISGIQAVVFGRDSESHPVTVRHDPGLLNLTAEGYTLSLTRPLPVATSSAPASATAT